MESKRRALVADDDRDLRDAIASILEVSGYSVDQAWSGNEAVRMIATGEYVVVFTDNSMPDGDGFVVIAECRKRGIPVFMISDGYGSPDLVDRATKAGVRAFLNKPVDADELLREASTV